MAREADVPEVEANDGAKSVTRRRVGSETSARRTLLLDTAQKLMVEEGYAAVSTRRVAAEAGLKPPLVHYYFPTTDDLLLAVYRRAADNAHARTMATIREEDPIAALWTLNSDVVHSALAVELMALANHRPAIHDEMQRTAERFRALQAEALAEAYGDRLDPEVGSPLGIKVVIEALSRAIVMEKGRGITLGHAEVRDFVKWLLARAVADPVQTGVD